jgi:dextranase
MYPAENDWKSGSGMFRRIVTKRKTNYRQFAQWITSAALILLLLVDLHAADISAVLTDKARYAPSDTIRFTAVFSEPAAGLSLEVAYFHLNQPLEISSFKPGTVTATEWTWLPPETDYRGYLAVVQLKNGDQLTGQASIAVDVSSDWARFPRYGFLSKYPYLNSSQIEQTLTKLNRFHINGLQFYDWHHKHHKPLKGSAANPDSSWNDIANRTNYFATVAGYIDMAHEFNMVAMSYNLLYGAWDDAASDGAPSLWRLFRDTNHSQPDYHDLPDSWASDIFLMDIANPLWNEYIISNTGEAFAALPFDGWHIDQLGDRGALYNYDGQYINLYTHFYTFIGQAKDTLQKRMIMNAVNQYGQSQIALAPVDILYSEVWDPNTSYGHLISVINENNFYRDGELATVLAAYVNEGLSGSQNTVNTPSVLLADAVIFAAGGSHIELGEHYLGNPYFPNDNLHMSVELTEQLTGYYDFLVAYQNLLRDEIEPAVLSVVSPAGYPFSRIIQQGKIWFQTRQKGSRKIIQLVNFSDATTLEWRDNSGIQAEPEVITQIPLQLNLPAEVISVWLATPDSACGAPVELPFTRSGDMLNVTIPYLKYWSMLVIETDPVSAVESSLPGMLPHKTELTGSYPNPFNPAVHIRFSLARSGKVRVDFINTLGQLVAQTGDQFYGSGENRITWQPDNRLSAGIYFARLHVDDRPVHQIKIIYLK